MISQRIHRYKINFKTHFLIKSQDRFETADQICWMVPQLHHSLKEGILIIVKTLISMIKLKKQIQTSSTQQLSTSEI
jgi:Tfp pilus assembly protein PilZ